MSFRGTSLMHKCLLTVSFGQFNCWGQVTQLLEHQVTEA